MPRLLKQFRCIHCLGKWSKWFSETTHMNKKKNLHSLQQKKCQPQMEKHWAVTHICFQHLRTGKRKKKKTKGALLFSWRWHTINAPNYKRCSKPFIKLNMNKINYCPPNTHVVNYQNLVMFPVLMCKCNISDVNCVMMNLTKLKDTSAQSGQQKLFPFPPTILLRQKTGLYSNCYC